MTSMGHAWQGFKGDRSLSVGHGARAAAWSGLIVMSGLAPCGLAVRVSGHAVMPGTQPIAQLPVHPAVVPSTGPGEPLLLYGPTDFDIVDGRRIFVVDVNAVGRGSIAGTDWSGHRRVDYRSHARNLKMGCISIAGDWLFASFAPSATIERWSINRPGEAAARYDIRLKTSRPPDQIWRIWGQPSGDCLVLCRFWTGGWSGNFSEQLVRVSAAGVTTPVRLQGFHGSRFYGMTADQAGSIYAIKPPDRLNGIASLDQYTPSGRLVRRTALPHRMDEGMDPLPVGVDGSGRLNIFATYRALKQPTEPTPSSGDSIRWKALVIDRKGHLSSLGSIPVYYRGLLRAHEIRVGPSGSWYCIDTEPAAPRSGIDVHFLLAKVNIRKAGSADHDPQ